ncbi:aldehyde dehydrogenase family protein [Paracoccus sp. S-4012]|uniref:NAD-dependent succinate-semialdehyde dehydrogenase n=1 Tax=Paracoccus sp. S-4012 TaxID=2665648 RepID=UPI0012B04E8E|nr:NAD-dependent succinate-semialdehyde dehydrogenase [Paracoccus sp. S-4012]MRX51801.1 aldehyde dehydrogenase family protein [Paracoccus sp. S-4012]
MTSYPDTQLLIDGAWRPGETGESLPVMNPATSREIGRVARATRADLDAALAACERGFAEWSRVSAFERGKIMRKAAQLLRDRADVIAPILTLENGKPLAQARIEIMSGADIIDWFAGEGQRAYGQVIPSRAPDVIQIAMKMPVGPVAAFTPWNFPVNQVVRKLSLALAAGCSIIVKGPEETPASPAELVRAFVDAGVPAGVINLVYGNPAEISEYLIPHPVIRKISFTGSTPVGKQLAALAGLHMKRATMELGGHAPVIVAGDADIDQALDVIAPYKFRNAGQVCISPTRFLVQDALHDEFTERFTEIAAAVKIGSGLDEGVEMGPLANERRIPALEGMIADAVERGARLTTGGRRIGNEGWFFEPTVLAEVPVEARIMNEEPFGPVAVINRFGDLDEAIAEANRLPFGLAAYAFTRDSATANRLGREIAAGMTSINHIGLALPEVPFGGINDSGHGTEGGSEAIEAYLETRFVTRKG